MTFAVFLLLYRYLPHHRPGWRAAILGSAAAAIGFQAVQVGLGWYLSGPADFSKVYGSASAIFVFLFSVYLSASAFVICAILTAVLDERLPLASLAGRRQRRNPARVAELWPNVEARRSFACLVEELERPLHRRRAAGRRRRSDTGCRGTRAGAASTLITTATPPIIVAWTTARSPLSAKKSMKTKMIPAERNSTIQSGTGITPSAPCVRSLRADWRSVVWSSHLPYAACSEADFGSTALHRPEHRDAPRVDQVLQRRPSASAATPRARPLRA